jgi:hypothetical protein
LQSGQVANKYLGRPFMAISDVQVHSSWYYIIDDAENFNKSGKITVLAKISC